jgi:hypothetical protein
MEKLNLADSSSAVGSDIIKEETNDFKSIAMNSRKDSDTSCMLFPNGNFKLNKEVVELIQIKKYKNFNNAGQYLINLQKYSYHKKINFIKNPNEITSFPFLDVDHKTQIKNFQSFNYNSLNNSAISLDSTCTPDKNNISFNALAKSKSAADNQIIEHISPYFLTHDKDNLHLSLDFNSIKKSKKKNKIKKNKNPTPTGKYNGSIANYNYLNNSAINAEKPKYELKFCSFDMDANEQNLINDFVEPVLQYHQNSEYLQTDDFLNIDINHKNYYQIFDNIFDDGTSLEDQEKNSHFSKNEFVEDFLFRFNNSANKKNDNKFKDIIDDDHLIYMVNEKHFYRKLKNTNINTTDVPNYNNSFVNTTVQNSKSNVISSAIRDDSPKARVKVKYLPIKIIENHIN